MIGIIGAMAVEMEKLLSEIRDAEKETISGRDFYRGTLRDKPVVCVQAGIGKVNAALCAEALILRYAPELVINIGVGGALSDHLRIGDIAVAEDLVQHDVDTTAIGDPIGLVSTVNRVDFPCWARGVDGLMRVIEKEGTLRGVRARIASGDQFIHRTEDKRRIVELFHADVCEMEGGAIAQVCYVNGVDFLVLRSISDATDGSHVEDYNRFCAMAADRSATILMKFLEKL